MTERNRQFAGLSPREIFLAHDAALFSGRNKKSQGVAVMHHHSIGSEIYPAFVGIDGDVHGAGADVAPAIELMPFGAWKLEHVDVFFFDDVLHHRAVFDYVGLE